MQKSWKTPYRKGLMASLCAAALMFGVGEAQAFTDPATLLPPDSTIQFKYNDLEIIVSQEGDVLSGIFAISSLGGAGGTPIYWASGLSGSELNGFFTDLTVAFIDTTDPNNTVIYFTGGVLNVYNVPVGSYNPTAPPVTDAQICGGACPSPWLTFDFSTGVAVDNPLTPFDESTATLVSTVSSLTAPLTGTGDSFLVVTGGTAAATFGIGSQFSLQSNLQSCPAPAGSPFAPNCEIAGGWPIASFDPVVGRTARVPEPATLALVGLGLLGLGALRRKSS